MACKTTNKALIVALLCASVFAGKAFAGGWEGGNGETSGGSTSEGGGGVSNFPCDTDTIDCKGVSWLKYDYVGGEAGANIPINFAPRGGSGNSGRAPETLDDVGQISGECAKSNVGFYHLGINTPTSYSQVESARVGIHGNFYNDGSTISGYRTGQGTQVNAPYFSDDTDRSWNYFPTYAYLGGNDTYIHRGSFTKSVLNGGISSQAYYYDMAYGAKSGKVPIIDTAAYTYDHTLYYRQSNGKYIKLYKSKSKASTEDAIKTAYVKFLNYMYPTGGSEALRNSKSSYCTYSGDSWSCSNVPSDVYAFCAFGEGEQPKKIKNRSILQYDNYESVSDYAGETNFDNANSFKDAVTSGKTKYTNSTVISVKSSTVTVSAKFDFKTTDGKNYKSKTFSYTEDVIGDKPAPAKKTTSFNGTNAISGESINDTVVINLYPGVEKTVCATVTSDETIQPTSSSTANSGSTTSKACMKFLWDPVVSKVHSTTTVKAKVDGVMVSDGSGPDNTGKGEGNLWLGEAKPEESLYNSSIAYGKNALAVTWSHSLYTTEQQYYTKLTNGQGYINYFDTSGVIVHARPDSSEVNSALTSVGRTQTITPGAATTINGWKSTIFTRPLNPPLRYKNESIISEDLTLVPGQPINATESIYHDSEVYGNGELYTGSTEDTHSSASVTGVANYAECKLTGNNNTTVTKYIGVGAANDYAGHYVDSSKGKVIVGDATGSNSETIWLKGNDTAANLTFNYEACFGEQIAEDYANGGDTTNIDTFQLNTAEYASTLGGADGKICENFSSSNDPYNLANVYNDNRAINDCTISGRRTIKNLANKHILADELGTGGFEGRLNNGYAIKSKTKKIAPSKLLGHSNVSSISKTQGINGAVNATYSITTNVPYNYILNPQPTNKTSLEVLTVGSSISFEGNIGKNGRKNPKVDSTNAYETNAKTTTVKTNVFMLDSNESVGVINPSGIYNGQISYDNVNYRTFTIEGKDQNASIEDLIGHSVMTEDRQFNEMKATYPSPDGLTVGNEIGKKYCFAIAVYPADSHNIGTSDITDSTDQTAALIGDVAGANALWRVSVSCRTVAKYPSLSVEGNGVRAGGSVKTSRAYIRGNVFGSWVEYGLVSAPGSNIATGATLAYATVNNNINASGDVNNGNINCFGIQSVGNNKDGKNCDDVGSSSEAQMVIDEIGRTRSNLSRYRTTGGSEISPGAKIYISSENGIYSIYSNGNSNITGIINSVASGAPGIDTIAVNFSGTFEINENIISPSKRQILIFADDIVISNNAKRIDAWLIANKDIDTCKEANVGNDNLGDACNNSLIINGSVISHSISLDRTYGAEADGDDVGGNIRRGEIFNYDPSSVLWAYKESLKDSKTDIRYIKERAVRY